MPAIKNYDYRLPFGLDKIPRRDIGDFLTDVVESLASVDQNFKDDVEGNARLRKALKYIRRGNYEFEEFTETGEVTVVVSLLNAQRALAIYESRSKKPAEKLISRR